VNKGESVPRLLVGTSGWSYPHWRGIFYPPELKASGQLLHYVSYFDTVELNASFYRMPSEKAFRSWKATAPEGFCFAVKGHRYVTHLKKLRDVNEHLERFFERVRLLEEALGPILFQLPPRWNCNLDRLQGFLALLPSDLRFAIEFRSTSWLNEEVFSVLEEHGTALCIASLPNFDCPVRSTAPYAYIRFHGAQQIYAGRYREDELRWWAEQISFCLADGRDVYAYFNNDAHGYAVENALQLKEMLR
jgi:uncharacterized protein YecE (DUF72 family)